MQGNILIIDDDTGIRDGSSIVLKRQGFEVYEAATGEEASHLLQEYDFDLILLDLKLPDVNGLDFLKQIRETDQIVSVIIITAFGTVQNAVEAMRLGANDFLSKPFEPEELRLTVNRNIKTRKITLENIYLKEELKKREGDVKIIGRGNAIIQCLSQAEKIAPTDTTVLVTGESGTGKGLMARYIHEKSLRHSKSFVSVDCATLVPSLFESELFGHLKGSFTGATSNRTGKFEIASGGTLFLDEIGNVSMELQAKLLKAVEEKIIYKVGGANPIKVDTRIIAATNKDLKELVKTGQFREDLYFRLNVVSIVVPPLRERKEDLKLLIEYFLVKFSQKYNKKGLYISSDAMEFLSDYDWPGNIRELENMMERLTIFARENVIKLEDIDLSGATFWIKKDNKKEEIQDDEHFEKKQQPFETFDLMPLDEIEKIYVLKVLEDVHDNKTEASQILGIDRKTLGAKLKKWGIK
jgi:two-component system response regulator HydG